MHYIHLHLSMSIAVVGVVDSLSKDLVIERIIQSQRKDLIEYLQNLTFEVWRFDLDCNIVKHVLYILKVSLIERIHSLDSHPGFINRNLIYIFTWRKSPAKETLTKVEVFVVGNRIRKNRTYINT